MYFIGQKPIINQLGLLLPDLYKSGDGCAMLFRGPSGYGKTLLAKKVANYLAGRNYTYQLGNDFTITTEHRVHFIDEIHLCPNPEVFYPIIDKGSLVLIFATNFDSLLPEAFQNRCINFNFIAYTDRQLEAIFKKSCKILLDKPVIKHIIDIANRNPRIIVKTFIKTVELLAASYGERFALLTNEEIIALINEIHGIKDGLLPNALEYLKVLKELGGKAPIDTIVNVLHLDKNTIKYEIEPALLTRKLIKISSKGRELWQ